MGTLIGLLPLAAAVAAFAVLVTFMLGTPRVVLYGIGAFILIAWELPSTPAISSFGGISIYPEDVLFGAMAIALAARSRQHVARLKGRPGAWLVVFLFAFMSLARGVGTFGVASAVNEFRATAYLIATTAWVLSYIDDDGFRRSFDRFLTALGWALVGLAVYHVSVRGLGSPDELVPLRGLTFQTSRPLVAGQAAVLALIGLARLVQKRPWSAGAFLLVAFLCQHRSVWAAMAGAFVLLAVASSPKVRARLAPALVLVPLLTFVAWGVGLLGGLPTKIEYALTSTGTIDGRTFAWTTLISRQNAMGFDSIMLGQPYGSGFDRINALGNVESFAPHNWFVVLYLRLGLLATVLVAGMLGMALVRAMRARDDLLIAWMALLIVYCVPYNLTWYMAPFLAWGLSARSVHGVGVDQEAFEREPVARTAGRSLLPTGVRHGGWSPTAIRESAAGG